MWKIVLQKGIRVFFSIFRSLPCILEKTRSPKMLREGELLPIGVLVHKKMPLERKNGKHRTGETEQTLVGRPLWHFIYQ